ncbi:MAG: cytochrome c553 [Limisphaerales bacterium]|jgi:cytochrome c553
MCTLSNTGPKILQFPLLGGLASFSNILCPHALVPFLNAPHRVHLWLACLFLISLTALAAPATAAIPADQLEFFESRIRPILVSNCYKCHSQGADRSKGGLLVDSGPALLAGGDSGPAIVPGNPGASRLIKAIKYTDPDLEMPPEDSKLPDYVIRDFETWISNGAADPRGTDGKKTFIKPKSPQEHWSFQPVFKPIPPIVRKDWKPMIQNDIDRFVFARLPLHELSPSPKADRVTLIRRVTFNLIGLPPTLPEVDAFLADTNSNAFETVVDRLLESKRYGERWGRHWLDVARYGDTTGGRGRRNERFNHSYTYRDWVIKAFNEDMPYPDFIKYQLAADRLTESDTDYNLAAMGFLTLGNRFNNSQDDVIDDRIDVVSKGFLGLTVTCARCHDHKFDPIPTADYYSLHGIFRSSREPEDLPALNTDTNTPLYRAYQQSIAYAEAKVAQFDRGVWYRAKQETLRDTGKYLHANYLHRRFAEKEDYDEFMEERDLNPGVAKIWRKALDEWRGKSHPIFGLWFEYEKFPPDNFRAEGIKLMRGIRTDDAKRTNINAKVYRAFISPPSTMGYVATNYANLLLRADKRWQSDYFTYLQKRQSKPDLPEPKGLDDANDEAIRQVIYDTESPAFLMNNERWKQMARGLMRSERELRDDRQELVDEVAEVKLEHAGAPARPVILVDAGNGSDSRIYVKGNRRQRGSVAPRRFLEILSPDQRNLFRDGSGRLELANAIATEDNPLTARVMANRVWLHQFGQGIVRSPNDFGTRCDGPSHPQLLDYLAWRFMEEGWSIKKLQKHIVMSYIWQQSSDDNPRKFEKDPSNLWLWQMNRRRLDFEAMRDTILHIGGRLDLSMGGPPVRLDRRPYPTRRSVYGLVDRANLPDMLRAFDFPNPDSTSGQRDFTIVPQQALFMMNSTLVMQQAVATVKRGDLLALPSAVERINMLYRLIYSRYPNTTELYLGRMYLASEGRAPRGPLPGQPPWEYGVAVLDYNSGIVNQFWPMSYNERARRFQPGRAFPDRTFGRGFISAQGGNAPNNNRTVVRRWTAPDDMLVEISGTLSHSNRSGDGVRGRIVYSKIGMLGRWGAARSQASTPIPRLRVEAGQTVEFVIDCRGTPDGDAFTWPVTIQRLDDSQTPPVPVAEKWGSARGFSAPSGSRRLYPWEKYAQVLLETNELTFIN